MESFQIFQIKDYTSEYSFRIYDWLEECLLLRCQGGLFTGADIDLIFWGVKYLELPLLLRGVRITRPRDKETISYEEKYAPDKLAEPGDRTYLIESEGNKFYIIASNFWILENNNHVSESSLIPLLSQEEVVREKYFNEVVGNCYKIE